MWNPFAKQNSSSYIEQAARKVAEYRERQKVLEEEKESRTHRQVELWSILNLSPELEKEYHEVTLDITYLINQGMAIDQYLRRLQVAAYRLKNGLPPNGASLQLILEEPDPTLAVKREVPRVSFTEPIEQSK